MTRPVRSDFIARVQMPVFAEQNDADFVLVHVERDAEHIAGKRHQFIKAHAGKPDTLAMPVATLVIVPTSRGVSCGVKASRTWLIPANALSKTRSGGSQAARSLFGCSFRWRWVFGSGLGSARLQVLVLLFQKFVDALFQ
jgi:hypothetical protein